jgi:predicted NodU family carbamoyl transferase
VKVLGINTSHESSICQMTDGKIDWFQEEARWRRDKHWVPSCVYPEDPYRENEQRIKIGHDNWKSIEWVNETQEKDWDEVGFVSYDRRIYDWKYEPSNYLVDRAFFDDLRGFIKAEPLSRDRWEEASEKFLLPHAEDGDQKVMRLMERVVDPEIEYNEENDIDHVGDDLDMCTNEPIANQLGIEQFDFLQNEHHLFHALCGLYLSPFEDALAIVCDGGGSQFFYELYPQYQEIESIYYLSKQDIDPLYKHLSNARLISDRVGCWDNQYFAHDQVFGMDDLCSFDVDLSSKQSEGMKFSTLSEVLGFDKYGRAAGKVMGMASYGLSYDINNGDHWGKNTLSGMLQRSTIEHTANLIQRALDYKPECNRIILTGGYALNCVANYEYLKLFPNVEFFVDPCAHDGGTAIGSCVKNTFYREKEYSV